MKKVLLLIAVALTLTASANKPKPSLTRPERKIERAIIKMDIAFKKTKNFDAAFAAYKKLTNVFGAEKVKSVMQTIKTCFENCEIALDNCESGCQISLCNLYCEQKWVSCWLACGGIWGS